MNCSPLERHASTLASPATNRRRGVTVGTRTRNVGVDIVASGFSAVCGLPGAKRGFLSSLEATGIAFFSLAVDIPGPLEHTASAGKST